MRRDPDLPFKKIWNAFTFLLHPLRSTLLTVWLQFAGIRFGIMSAHADPNPAPSLASET